MKEDEENGKRKERKKIIINRNHTYSLEYSYRSINDTSVLVFPRDLKG